MPREICIERAEQKRQTKSSVCIFTLFGFESQNEGYEICSILIVFPEPLTEPNSVLKFHI